MEKIGDALAAHFGYKPASARGEWKEGEKMPLEADSKLEATLLSAAHDNPWLDDMRNEHCYGKSWGQIAEEETKRRKDIEDEHRKRWMANKLKKTHIPKTFLDARAEAKWAAAFLEEPGTGLYIYGDTGTGKTWQACGIVTEYAAAHIMHPNPAVFKRFGDILDDCIKYGRPETLDFYMHVPLLCLDDLGKEKPTEYALETLYRLIDTRRSEELPTIITSNLDPRGLANYFCMDGGRAIGDAVLERLKDYTIIHATQRYSQLSKKGGA